MKILLFFAGLWFAWWNLDSLRENPLAAWNFIAFTAALVLTGLWLFLRVFDWMVSPSGNYRKIRYDQNE